MAGSGSGKSSVPNIELCSLFNAAKNLGQLINNQILKVMYTCISYLTMKFANINLLNLMLCRLQFEAKVCELITSVAFQSPIVLT